MRLPKLRIEPHAFAAADFVAGHPVLDFVNTAAGLNLDPRDWLDSYGRLVEWALMGAILTPAEAIELNAVARSDPPAAERALARARALRAALYQLAHAVRTAHPLEPGATATLARWLRKAAASAELQPAPGRLDRRLTLARAGLDLIALRLAEAGLQLLQSDPPPRLGVCDGRNCGWLFIDVSRSGARRWCDMATCGNAAKAHRHYQRRRVAKARPAR